MDVQIVGVRVGCTGVEDFRGVLWDTLRHSGATLRLLTAYWSAQTFDFLEELEWCGVDRTKLLLALNPAGFNRSAVERAATYASAQHGRELRMAKADGILHPKLVVVERSAKATDAFIGSSNFTAPGLTWNVELNVWLHVEDTDSSDNPVEILSDTFDAFFETATSPTRDDFSRLGRAAPTRAQFERETPIFKRMTQALEQMATIGTEPTALPSSSSSSTVGNGGPQLSNVSPSTEVQRRLARLFPDPAEREIGMGMLAALIERVDSQYGADQWAATVRPAAEEVNIVVGALHRLRLVERAGRGVIYLPLWHLNSRLKKRILDSGGGFGARLPGSPEIDWVWLPAGRAQSMLPTLKNAYEQALEHKADQLCHGSSSSRHQPELVADVKSWSRNHLTPTWIVTFFARQ